ncbi:MAG: AAA family ATPase, partial [Candidatus Fermentibacteraceae bacterium]|nr:AAA family ATPase [Candidatus Fermentibacteraceae bacterium]
MNTHVQQQLFFGREKELSELSRKLMEPGCTVLTITGIGGVGKTSTAMKLAEDLQFRFDDGVYFVPLSGLEHSGQVAPAIASKLGLRISGGSFARQLKDILKQKNLLLVLDNFEHLISASSLVEEIGLASEQVKMLVTSRTRLNIAGEFVYELSGMTIPEEDTHEILLSSPPVRLFLSNPDVDGKLDLDDMKTVVQICRSVNGVPLGIVLASSWLIEMTPLEILRRISETEDLLN